MSKPPTTRRTPQPTFDVRLRALPRDDDPDGTRRLLGLLKVALKSFGLRCTKIDFGNGGSFLTPDSPPSITGRPRRSDKYLL